MELGTKEVSSTRTAIRRTRTKVITGPYGPLTGDNRATVSQDNTHHWEKYLCIAGLQFNI